MVNLIANNWQLMLIAEFEYVLHVLLWEYGAHWIGWVYYEDELGFRGDEGAKVG